MNRERIQLLMNRIIDGEANANERVELSRALKADPMLSEEYAELQLVHRATENLFSELRLPQNFSKNVMSRLQPRETPADLATDSVRLPSIRAHAGPNQVAHIKPRKNVFTLVASLASAAAILLTAGIMFASMSGNNVQNPETLNSGVDQGVLDDSGTHRTEPLPPDSKRGDAPGNNPDASSNASETIIDRTDSDKDDNKSSPNKHIKSPDGNSGDDVIENEGDKSEEVAPKPEGPTFPEDSGNDPVVEGESDAPESEKPDALIERESAGDKEHKTEVGPDNRRKIGQMQVLSGYLLEYVNGDWQKLKDTANIREGSRLKTNVNGIVMLELENGRVTLGKDTEIHLLSSEELEIVDGEVSLSRNSMDSAGSLSVVSNDLTWTQQAGISVIERKRTGLEVQNVLGNGLLSNEDNGLLEIFDGYEVRANFGKELKEGRAKRVTLSNWSAESRAVYMSYLLEPVISDREYDTKALKFINRTLIRDLSKLLRQPVSGDGLFYALSACIENRNLSGRDFISIIDEIDGAVFKYQDIDAMTLMSYAMNAGHEAEGFENWQTLFQHQITPPPAKGNPTKMPTVPGTSKPPT